MWLQVGGPEGPQVEMGRTRQSAKKRSIRRALQREQRTTTTPQSPTGIASGEVGMARVGEDGFEELDGLRVQMDADEERLAKTMSDFDMLCAHRDAVARACQVWSECVCARATAGER
jgi:hypothetical protein